MAVQPPPAQPVVPQQAAPPPPASQKSGCFGRGCGCGCAGCLISLVLVALLVAGSGYFFLVAQASAALNAPATLIVFNQPVTVNDNPAVAGQSLDAGSVVATRTGGHASIEFPDGSFVRMAPSTTVTLSSAQLRTNGNLQSVSLVQKVGRTFTNVQHLAGGASFQVNGHSVSATVRGTQFEVLVRPDGTNRIWAFIGTVTVSGKKSVTLTAGQEIDGDANGNLANLRANQFDTQDAFPVTEQCSTAAASGNNPGTVQSTTGDNLTAGQTAQSDYYSVEGSVTVTLCYPGSLMSLTVIDPGGIRHTKVGPPPVSLKIQSGAPGLYRAVIQAISVPAAGEPYSISFATDAACGGANVDTPTAVRGSVNGSQIAHALDASGSIPITIQVQGTSPVAARVVYTSIFSGQPVSWSVDFFTATPNLGFVITHASVRSLDVTTRVITALTWFNRSSLNSISTPGYVVDRVYSCEAGGGGVMVIEGHH